MSDYIVALTITVEVRIENVPDREMAVDMAVEQVEREVDETPSLYMSGIPHLDNVAAA